MTAPLKTFSMTRQYCGDFFAGFPWDIYGTGTYRTKVTAQYGIWRMKRFMERLGENVKAPIPYIAVSENRPSGCGMPEIAFHFHFLAACPPQYKKTFAQTADSLWEKMAGNSKVVAYNPEENAAYYLAKLVESSNFDLRFDNLDHLTYAGPQDLFLAAQTNPYVPDHAKGHTRLNTLVVRHGI